MAGSKILRRRSVFRSLCWLSLVVWAFPAHAEPEVEAPGDSEILIEEIGPDLVLAVVAPADQEEGWIWYLVEGQSDPIRIGASLSAMHEVTELEASPDFRQLAVLSVGEGHPAIEIVDLEELRSELRYVVVAEIDPYPGSIAPQGWDDDALLVESDIALTFRGPDGRVPSSLVLPEEKVFLFRPGTNEIEPVTFDLDDLIVHHLSTLAHDSAGMRAEAARALAALRAISTLPDLEAAFEVEEDPSTREVLLAALQSLGSAQE